VKTSECHDDETAATAAAVLILAVAWFAVRGVRGRTGADRRGGCHRSLLWRDTWPSSRSPRNEPGPTDRRPTARSNASTAPWPKAGLQEALQLRERPPSSTGRMAPRVQPPTAPHRDRRVRTHHQVDQPHRSVRLKGVRTRQLVDEILAYRALVARYARLAITWSDQALANAVSRGEASSAPASSVTNGSSRPLAPEFCFGRLTISVAIPLAGGPSVLSG
jgi:hypothetical protein